MKRMQNRTTLKSQHKFKSVMSKLLIFSMCFSMSVGSNVIPMKVYAEEINVLEHNKKLGASPEEWQSSNLREWLNSDQTTVSYTGIAPSYKSEAGFLSSNNFTQAERDSIAVTRHAGNYTYGGTNVNNTLYLSQRSVLNNNYIYNDKVFVLGFNELVKYVEQNKQLMNSNKKYYSNYLQKQTNKKDKYDYLVNGGYRGSGWLNESSMYTATLSAVTARTTNNIVPALSLNPTYVLSNGRKASDLVVGSTVTFGKYNGEAIEWQVINKTDDGYPLLWSTRILTTKEYDAEGDINPKTSNYINFSSYNVDLISAKAKSWEQQENIISAPVISFDNESELTTPTNNTSITLKIRVTDANNSIRKITLPDGKVVTNANYTEWTLTENGEYDIIAENSQGVITVRHIVTKAINTPAEVSITTDKANDTKWTNKPINVNVSATNNGVYTRTAKANKNMGYGTLSAGGFPLWMSLGGKRVRITGTIKNALSDADYAQINPNIRVDIKLSEKWYSNNQIGNSWPGITGFTLKELKEKGEINVDYIYTFPSDIYDARDLYIELSGASVSRVTPYNYWLSDFTFEILDKDDLKITQIILPDGNIVNDDKATYTVFKDGSYTFTVKDNRGKVTSKTIDLAVDTVKPNLTVTGGDKYDKSMITLNLKATDDLSGIKNIKLPNGEYRYTTGEGQSLSVDYNITANGSYTFIAYDMAGNSFTKTVNIDVIDSTAPTINLSQNPTVWTTGKVTISASATDSKSGVKNITLPNGSVVSGSSATYEVSSNGTYTFKSSDNLGNTSTKSITVNNIDVISPTLTLTKASAWSNKTMVITATANDNQSGVSKIVLPNGNAVNSATTTYTVSEIGAYYFTTVDNVGNSSLNYIIIDNIDKENPKVSIQNNQEWNNSSGVRVDIEGVDY